MYFWKAEQWLKAHTNMDMLAILTGFVQCCRTSSNGVSELLTRLDDIAQRRALQFRIEAWQYQPHGSAGGEDSQFLLQCLDGAIGQAVQGGDVAEEREADVIVKRSRAV